MTYRSHADKVKRDMHDKIAGQLTDMAADAVKLAQKNANQAPPGHPQVQTGTLRRAITLDVDKKKLEAKVGIMKGSAEGDKALVYAHAIEFGFGTRPPYPYLFPAIETINKKVKDYIRR